jgi:hypothetical protein
MFLNLSLQLVEARVTGDDGLRKDCVSPHQRSSRVDEHLFRQPAEFGDSPAQERKILVEAFADVIIHEVPPNRSCCEQEAG